MPLFSVEYVSDPGGDYPKVTLKDEKTGEIVKVNLTFAEIPTNDATKFTNFLGSVKTALQTVLDNKVRANKITIQENLMSKISSTINTLSVFTPVNTVINNIKSRTY